MQKGQRCANIFDPTNTTEDTVMQANEILAQIRESKYKHYVYILRRPSGEAFYVGKGQGKRVIRHAREALNGGADIKCNIIRKILRDGGLMVYELDSFHADSDSALEREVCLIAKLGRINIGTGSLANLTDGGDGVVQIGEDTRRKMSEAQKAIPPEIRKRMAASSIGRKNSEESKIKASLANKGRVLTEEHRAALSKSATGRKLSDEHKKKISDSKKANLAVGTMLGKKHTEEARKKISQVQLGRKASEETKAKMRIAHQKRLETNKANDVKIEFSEEAKLKMSIAAKARCQRKKAEKAMQQ